MKHDDNHYKKGCRCEACTEAHRVAVAAGRARRLAAGKIKHGDTSGYDDGCRCEFCREAHRIAIARGRERKRSGKTFLDLPHVKAYLESLDG